MSKQKVLTQAEKKEITKLRFDLWKRIYPATDPKIALAVLTEMTVAVAMYQSGDDASTALTYLSKAINLLVAAHKKNGHTDTQTSA